MVKGGVKGLRAVDRFLARFLHLNFYLRYTSAIHESHFLVYNMSIMWLAGWIHPRYGVHEVFHGNVEEGNPAGMVSADGSHPAV